MEHVSHEFILCREPQRNSPGVRHSVRANAARVSAPLSTATRSRNRKLQKARIGTSTQVCREERGAAEAENQRRPYAREQDQNLASISSILEISNGNSRSIPAAATPVFYLPYIPAVVSNYLTCLAVPFAEIDGPRQTGLLAKSWFPMVLHSPAVFQVIVLFSASHLASRSPSLVNPEALLYLKQCALSSLFNMIASRRIGDEVIAATAKMASYEAIFGSGSDYHIHMDAVRRMLVLRGGIEKLGLEGLLMRLLLFIDTNSAYILHTNLYLEQSMLPRRQPLSFLNPPRFVGED